MAHCLVCDAHPACRPCNSAAGANTACVHPVAAAVRQRAHPAHPHPLRLAFNSRESHRHPPFSHLPTLQLSGNERILRTPIPTGYTRFTGRAVLLYVLVMPLLLWSITGVLTPIVSVSGMGSR